MSEALTADEARRLVDAVGGGCVNVRDRAYITLLYRCGLRNNEARLLDLQDVHLGDRSWLRVRFPKGIKSGRGKPRDVGIDARARAILEEWLELRGTNPGALFFTRKLKRISTSHFRTKMKLIAKKARISRRVHPHALRHTFAKELDERGVNLRLIQGALGHRHLNTTAVYLPTLGSSEVIEATADLEW